MILTEKDKYEIVSLAIATKILDEFWIYYEFNGSKEFSIKIYKENKEYEIIDVPNFSKMVEEEDFSEFKESYEEFLSNAYKIKYKKELKIYEECDLEKIEYVNRITSVLGDNNGRLVPLEYEYVDTRCSLSDSVSDNFWINGGIEYLENQLDEECPNIAVAHYKGKSFYLYERIDNSDSAFTFIYMEDLDNFLNDADLSVYEGKYDLADDYRKSANELYYDEFIYSEKISSISEQMKRAIKIIETTKENLEYESAIDYVIWGDDYNDNGCPLMRIIDESDIADYSLLETIVEDFRNHLCSIPEKDISDFIDNHEDYASKLFFKEYIKDGKFKFDVYKYNKQKYEREFDYTFEYDFMKVFREYVEKHVVGNYELLFDESYNSYKVVNLDIDDSYGYHINNIKLVFKTEEVIANAISNLDRRRDWFESQVRTRKLTEEAIKNSDLYSIKIKDSYNSGNCKVGTKKFCKLFNLPTDNESELPAKEFIKCIEDSPSEFKRYAERTLVSAYERYLEESNV